MQEKVQKLNRKNKISNIDFEREERTGIPEIVFGEKRLDDLIEIVKEILEKKDYVIITRIKKNKKEKLIKELKLQDSNFVYNERGKILIIANKKIEEVKKEKLKGKVGIITAGTSDIDVSEEAIEILNFFGCETIKEYDVGIAGLHRAIKAVERMRKENVNVVLVFAGMEGALPSIIAGLIDVPVIGIPTSIGYGTGEKGRSALLTMLNSCTPIAVVNIDNGYSAAIIAYKILREINKVKVEK
ncbi:MAG: nickel pincer cofactor biosynthesis protein LarB [Candidatus Altarchaeaceae archaeon]